MAAVAAQARPARDKPVLATCRTCGLDLPTTYYRHSLSHGKRYRHPDCRPCQRQLRAAAPAAAHDSTDTSPSANARAAILASLRDELAHHYARAIAAGQLTQDQAMTRLHKLKTILASPDPAIHRRVTDWPVTQWLAHLARPTADQT